MNYFALSVIRLPSTILSLIFGHFPSFHHPKMAILLATSYIMQLEYVPPSYVTTNLFILASSYPALNISFQSLDYLNTEVFTLVIALRKLPFDSTGLRFTKL